MLLTNALPTFFANGAAAAGYRLFFYENGTFGSTNTKQDTTDGDGGATNPNPITLNADGEPDNAGSPIDIWLTQGATYTVVLAPPGSDDPPTTTTRVVDDVQDVGSGGSEWVDPLAATYLSATTFSVVGNKTSDFVANRYVKLTSGADRYAKIVSSTYTTVTTVTVTDVTDSSKAATTLHASMDTVYLNIISRNFLEDDLASTATDDGTKGFNKVYYPPLSGETGITKYQYIYGDVRRYGAVLDGVTDDYTAVSNAQTSHGSYFIPDGYTCFIGTTLAMADNKVFTIGRNSTLLSDQGTVVRMTCEYSSLLGYGWGSVIQTSTYSPNGVVLLGHPNTTDADGVRYNTLDNFKILGADPFGAAAICYQQYTVGLMVFNSQSFNSGGFVYYNKVTNIKIQDVKDGLVLTPVINANFFDNILIWKFGQTAVYVFSPYSTDTWGTRYGYDWDTATLNSPVAENNFGQIFVDTGGAAYNSDPNYDTYTFTDGQSYAANATALRVDGHAVYLDISQILAEPTYGTAYEISANVTNSHIHGQFNIAGGNNNSPDGCTLINGSGGTYTALAIRAANLYKIQMMEAGSAATPSLFDRFDTDTGLYFPTPGEIAASVGGIERLSLDASGLKLTGYLGVGNTASNTNTPSGATVRQMPIYNQAGTLLGYIPIYGSAW